MYLTQLTSRMVTSRVNEARGRNGNKNNSKRVVRNLEERNVGTNGKSPKQDLTSA